MTVEFYVIDFWLMHEALSRPQETLTNNRHCIFLIHTISYGMNMRLNKGDWLKLGLEALAQEGPDGLTIDAMCTRAGKTRGSYYHHFSSAGDFLEQLLGWWEKTYTHEIIEKVERLGQPSDKLDYLNQLVAHFDPHLEQAFRALATRSKEATLTCQNIDKTRIDYLAEQYLQSPRYNALDAKILAQIEYAAWVGFQLISPEAKPQDMLQMYNGFLRLTGRS